MSRTNRTPWSPVVVAAISVIGISFTHSRIQAFHSPIHAFANSRISADAQVAPVNDLPNPYTTIEGWAKMPPGRTWGSTSAVAIDNDGTSVWVAERCGANNCVNSPLPPVLHFDANGNLLQSFGAGMIL
jgi:hypothetical protein